MKSKPDPDVINTFMTRLMFNDQNKNPLKLGI